MLGDEGDNALVRQAAARQLQLAVDGSPEVLRTPLDVIGRSGENQEVRRSAIRTVRDAREGRADAITALLSVAREREMRDEAIGSLWHLLTPSEAEATGA